MDESPDLHQFILWMHKRTLRVSAFNKTLHLLSESLPPRVDALLVLDPWPGHWSRHQNCSFKRASLSIKHTSDKPSVNSKYTSVFIVQLYMKDQVIGLGIEIWRWPPTFLFCCFCKNQTLNAFSTISSFNLLKVLMKKSLQHMKESEIPRNLDFYRLVSFLYLAYSHHDWHQLLE